MSHEEPRYREMWWPERFIANYRESRRLGASRFYALSDAWDDPVLPMFTERR